MSIFCAQKYRRLQRMGFKVLWWMVDWMKQWARESLLSSRFPFCSLCWRSQAFEPFQSQQNLLGNTVPLRDSSPQLFGLAVLALVGVDPEAPSGSSLLLPTQKYIVIIAIINISSLSLFLTFQTPGLGAPPLSTCSGSNKIHVYTLKLQTCCQ